MASTHPEAGHDNGAAHARGLDPESASATPWTDDARSGNPPLEQTSSEEALSSPAPNDPSASRWTSIVLPLRRVSRAVGNWIKGPQPPQIQKIRPFFPRLQSWPIRILNRYLPKRRQKITLLLAFYFCWLLTFVAILHHSAFANDLVGYGSPTQISCTASYW